MPQHEDPGCPPRPRSGGGRFAGSREGYGRPRRLPANADTPLSTVNRDGRSKVEGERLVAAARADGLRTATVRLANGHGTTLDHADRVVPACARAAAGGNSMRIDGAAGAAERGAARVPDDRAGRFPPAVAERHPAAGVPGSVTAPRPGPRVPSGNAGMTGWPVSVGSVPKPAWCRAGRPVGHAQRDRSCRRRRPVRGRHPGRPRRSAARSARFTKRGPAGLAPVGHAVRAGGRRRACRRLTGRTPPPDPGQPPSRSACGTCVTSGRPCRRRPPSERRAGGPRVRSAWARRRTGRLPSGGIAHPSSGQEEEVPPC